MHPLVNADPLHFFWICGLIVASKFDRFKSCWLQCMGFLQREGVQNIHHWSGRTETATENGVAQMEWCRHCGSHSSVASSIGPDQWCMFCALSLAIFPHAVMNWIQIWQIWRSQLRWDKFWSYVFRQLSGSTFPVSERSFRRLCQLALQSSIRSEVSVGLSLDQSSSRWLHHWCWRDWTTAARHWLVCLQGNWTDYSPS